MIDLSVETKYWTSIDSMFSNQGATLKSDFSSLWNSVSDSFKNTYTLENLKNTSLEAAYDLIPSTKEFLGFDAAGDIKGFIDIAKNDKSIGEKLLDASKIVLDSSLGFLRRYVDSAAIDNVLNLINGVSINDSNIDSINTSISKIYEVKSVQKFFANKSKDMLNPDTASFTDILVESADFSFINMFDCWVVKQELNDTSNITFDSPEDMYVSGWQPIYNVGISLPDMGYDSIDIKVFNGTVKKLINKNPFTHKATLEVLPSNWYDESTSTIIPMSNYKWFYKQAGLPFYQNNDSNLSTWSIVKNIISKDKKDNIHIIISYSGVNNEFAKDILGSSYEEKNYFINKNSLYKSDSKILFIFENVRFLGTTDSISLTQSGTSKPTIKKFPFTYEKLSMMRPIKFEDAKILVNSN